MDYNNTNRGALFRNDNKDPSDGKDRDYSGTLNIEGAEYWISGWVRTSQKSVAASSSRSASSRSRTSQLRARSLARMTSTMR